MKRMISMAIIGAILFIFSSCGQTINSGDNQVNISDSTAEFDIPEIQNNNIVSSSDIILSEELEEERQSIPESKDLGHDENEQLDFQNDELKHLIGEYEYLSDYGIGKLIISKTAYGYDISDYESESSYRFLANSSNIDIIENNRIYIKYPEQVFSDDTVIFSYYILEYSSDGINVYCAESVDEEGRFLYHATRENIDYETLGIQKYEYPSDFSMGENLKTAITQLALSYDNFGKDSVSSENWKEIFIARFIQNSRVSFDYLDMISDESGGQISVDQLNYIQWSLTDTELDFASEVGDSINRNDAASSLNYGWISEYSYEETNDGAIVTAYLETGYDGTDSMQKRKITVELIKNPYSCFDGYSVIAVSSETEDNDAQMPKYEGEYCDDNGDPSLEIRQNEDGSYLIQISLFRDIGYDACIGSLAEGKISFASDERGGVSGSITLDNDFAVVCFEHVGHFENAKVTTYMFHKMSDNPNIDELN